jgi:N-acetylneuraminic acid mutarotase
MPIGGVVGLLLKEPVMRRFVCGAISIAVICGCGMQLAFAQETVTALQPQTELKQWVKVDWSLGPDLPQGFQDSDGGVLGSWLITSGGFCSGGLEEDNRRKPGRYPRGFLNKTWGLNLEEKSPQWTTLPNFPGVARQGLFSAVVGESLYLWGGFSYSEPFCYADGYRLSRDAAGDWKWEPLPNLPSVTTSAALCVAGNKIYLCGGADYDGVTRFFTAHDRAKRHPRLGARLLVFDTERPAGGWQPLPECPGTPRFVHAFQQVGGKLYLIGGATGDVEHQGQRYGTCTVVDNWSFDPAASKWTRLRDLPISSGNFPKSSQLVCRDRFILLPGGHQYGHVANPDGSVWSLFGKASQKRPASGLHNDLFVYDTRTNQFGRGDSLPIDNNLPMSVIHGDRLYLIGGETGGGEINGQYFGHHPDLLLIGTLRLTDEAPAANRTGDRR